MKTKITIAGIILLSFLGRMDSFAQVYFGVKAGVNMETMAEMGKLWYNNNARAGSSAGIFTEVKMSDRWSLQLEMEYEEKGTLLADYEIPGVEEIIIDNDYLTIPLLSKYYFKSSSRPSEFYILNGPSLSYLLSSDFIEDNGEGKYLTDYRDDSYKTDLGLVFGGGLMYPLRNGNHIFGDVRYEMGLLKINKADQDLRNKVLELSVGIRF